MTALDESIQLTSPTSLARRVLSLIPPGLVGKYILATGLVGIVLVLYAATNLPLNQLQIVTVLFVTTFLVEWAPIKLTGTPLQGSNLSVSAAFAFAALLIFGIPASIIVNLGSAMAYCLKEKRPFYKRFFTTAALVVSSAASGLIFFAAGGQSPIVINLNILIVSGLAAGIYFLTNSSLISGAISLSTQRPYSTVLANWRLLFLQVIATLAIGMIMAFVYVSDAGLRGFLFASFLLVLPWYSIYFYVQKSRQISEQSDKLKQANLELEQANSALDLRIESLRALHRIGLSLNSSRSLQDILQQILTSVLKLSGADSTAVFLNRGGKDLTIAGHLGLSSQYLQAAEPALNGAANRALHQGEPLVMDKGNYHQAMLSAVAAREGIHAVACLPLCVAGEIVGGLDVCFKSEHTFTEDELNLLRVLAEQAAVAIQNARLSDSVHESYLSTIRVLLATVEAKDPYTRGHSEVVRQLAVTTGRQLGLSSRQIELLNLGALFHDIGKIGISETILRKQEQLTAEERIVMQEHPVIGENILSKVPALADVLPIVRWHHERYDGRGYPDGVSARENLLAAVVSVCDTFQAMTADRPYRKAYPHVYAIAELRRGAGTQFVPEVVDAFLTAFEFYDTGDSTVNRFDPSVLLPRKLRTLEAESLQNLRVPETTVKGAVRPAREE